MEKFLTTILSNYKYKINYKKIIRQALKEDIGKGDITSELLISKDSKSTGYIISKDRGILCGIEIAADVFKMLDKKLKIEIKKFDGSEIKYKDILLKITGSTRSILKGERLALNILQHLSGIATYTRKLASIVSKKGITILDSRKTSPNLRIIKKYAVKVGGGKNHRMGLYDGILIKDNHIKSAGSIEKAMEIVNGKTKLKIEVETKNIKEVKSALKYNPYIIMLDNFKPSEIKKAVKLIAGKCLIEVSGNINENNIKDYAIEGVNFISIGAITHSAKSLDLSLEII